MKKVLTIAGSDCSGGAGIQADLKTFSAHMVYGMSVITAITAQNTMGVTGIENVSREMVRKQLKAVCTDLVPDAVKIGMVSQAGIIEEICDAVKEYHLEQIVLDPVMISSSGHRLIEAEAKEALVEKLMPMAQLITPNIPEAEFLLEKSIRTKDDMREAAACLSERFGTSILLKGGHLIDCEDEDKCKSSDDLLAVRKGNEIKYHWIEKPRILSKNTHGTGCTLSSAIAANLAEGKTLYEAVMCAKEYIHNAISAGLKLGHGNGPINHCVKVENRDRNK